jgi:putative ABC transport system permease protein
MENVKLSTWGNEGDLIMGWINIYKSIFNIFLIFLVGIIVILIINLVSMIGLERRQEIGTLRAIGFSQFKTIFLFIGEVLLITGFFCLSGFVISVLIMSLMGQTGIAVTNFSLSWMTGDIFYPTLDVVQSVLIVAIIFGCSFFASIYPSFKATSLKPAETMKEM